MKISHENAGDEMTNGNYPESPFAKYSGDLLLGDATVDCYVLDTKERVISLGATVKAIAEKSGGNLGEYIGVSALKSYINKDLVLGETKEPMQLAMHVPPSDR